jgi:HD-like signal output (HDOD) protein
MSGPRKHILFVDDFDMLLRALKLAMKPERHRYEMEFANGAEQALALMGTTSFDLVISDMEMPGIDGIELLGHVKQHSPTTARVIMSGQLDGEAFIRAAPVMHRFLPKPAPVPELRATVSQIIALQSELADDALKALVTSAQLPSAPRIYLQLTQAANDPTSSIGDLAAIVSQDPATAGKLMQLASSAYYHAVEPPTTVEGAVSRLGVAMTRALCLSAYVFSLGSEDPKVPERLRGGALQKAATVSAELALSIAKGSPDIAFIAALLRVIGVLALLPSKRDALIAALNEKAQAGESRSDVERRMLGASLGQLSGHLLGLWGLPAAIIDTVRAAGTVPEKLDSGGAVWLAAAIADGDALDDAVLQRLGVMDELDGWKKLAAERAAAT